MRPAPNSRFDAQQHIRFPNITRLEFQGEIERARKTKTLSMAGLEINQLVVRKKQTHNPLSQQETEQQSQLKYMHQPNEGLINICTIKVNKNCSPDEQPADKELKQVNSVERKHRVVSQQKVFRQIAVNDDTKILTRADLPPKAQPISLRREPSRDRKEINQEEVARILNKLIAGSFGVICQASLQSFRAFVDRGNNSVLVKQILKNRPWWNVVMGEEEKDVSLSWTQFRQKKLTSVADIRMPTENKLQFTKQQVCWLESCQPALKLLIPQYDGSISITEVIKMLKRINEETRFVLEPRKLQLTNHIPDNQLITNKKALFRNLHAWYTSQSVDPFERIPVTFHVNSTDDEEFRQFMEYAAAQPKKKSLWVVKPGENTNRGNGITVQRGSADVKAQLESIHTKHTYIIQSYIRPYLYCERKFDIRCYALFVMINRRIRGYWYEEGYIRTASEPFSLKKTDKMIHLTNDAVQKHGQNYGRYEPGNKLSYQELSKYTNININRDFEKEVVPQMRDLCRDVFLSTQGKLGGDRSEDAFEVYGLDFMLDEELKPWLIEVNTNPCLQLSSSLLSRIIPEMLDNAFKIALDPFLMSSKKPPTVGLARNNRFELIFDS